MGYSREFLDHTIAVWQPYSPEPLSQDDAREIAQHVTDLLMLLQALDAKYGSEEADV